MWHRYHTLPSSSADPEGQFMQLVTAKECKVITCMSFENTIYSPSYCSRYVQIRPLSSVNIIEVINTKNPTLFSNMDQIAQVVEHWDMKREFKLRMIRVSLNVPRFLILILIFDCPKASMFLQIVDSYKKRELCQVYMHVNT